MKGKILGSRYQVLEYIAEGGFGRTYLAQDIQLPEKNLCVVKQLAPSFNAPKLLEIARRLFKTEATALHNLGHHPQIPELLAYFEEAEKFYLVQQYIKGQTLERELIISSLWTPNKVVDLLRDCLGILQYIHAQGVIHRDLKPANLIRRHRDQKIVLVDFGTVKNVLQGQTTLPQLTVAVGTQGYMPIEQARGKPRATSDLYALGIIGIQALTGVKPLELKEDGQGEIMWSHLVDAKPELKEVLTKMTRYNYVDRYQSAQSILNALNSCLDTVIILPHSAIAVNQGTIKPMLRGNQLEFQSELPPDPNALPGIRSVALVVDHTPKPVKIRFFQPKLWQAVLGAIVIAGGLYLALQGLFMEPDGDFPNSETTQQIE